ncbi:MAG TPA: UTP--glucose-1-phosphate uridylyltransferase GalU [Vicinamibacteria bacterium]|jgi:UTP--glucose-1-phosphate uridylyltransferase|nr:UTP--glucose-1-phosphate uridylyltransferase GalU [Vicinamibacteria bacterium]
MMKKIRKAVFPAAGLGTRFLPATKAQPKEMLPLVDKPIIQYVIEEAVASGITSIIIVTGRGKNAIEDHFDVSYELEKLLAERGKTDLLEQVRTISSMINLSYVRQGESLGLGHAVLVARDLVGDEPFAVMLGDDIIDSPVPCMKQMVEVFERHGGPVIAVQKVDRQEISAYGVIDGSPEGESGRVYRIRELVEKPRVEDAPSDLAIIGRYILTPDIFDDLAATPRDAGGEIQLTNGLRRLKERRPIFGYRFEGIRHDAGNKLGFLKATVEFALKRDDLGKPFREYLKSLKL